MLRADQQRAVGQPAELFEIEDQVVLTTPRVLERVSHTKRRWNRHVDPAIDTEGELRRSPGERDAGFLEVRSKATPVARQC